VFIEGEGDGDAEGGGGGGASSGFLGSGDSDQAYSSTVGGIFMEDSGNDRGSSDKGLDQGQGQDHHRLNNFADVVEEATASYFDKIDRMHGEKKKKKIVSIVRKAKLY
jgi:hypothetical protein